MTGTHVVTRPFDSGGRRLMTGDMVDASSWKNTERLVSTKYLRPASPVDLKHGSPVTPSAGASKFKKLIRKKR